MSLCPEMNVAEEKSIGGPTDHWTLWDRTTGCINVNEMLRLLWPGQAAPVLAIPDCKGTTPEKLYQGYSVLTAVPYVHRRLILGELCCCKYVSKDCDSGEYITELQFDFYPLENEMSEAESCCIGSCQVE